MLAALAAISIVAVAALAALLGTIHLTIKGLAERDKALLAKAAELMHTHMPTGDPIGIVQEKLRIEGRKQEEQAKHAAFQRELLAKRQAAQQQHLDTTDPEQD